MSAVQETCHQYGKEYTHATFQFFALLCATNSRPNARSQKRGHKTDPKMESKRGPKNGAAINEPLHSDPVFGSAL